MAKRKTATRRKKHTHYGPVRKHKRRVNGLQPAIVSGHRMHHRKRRRKKVSGVTGSPIMDAILGVAAGTTTGIILDKVIPDSVDKKIVSGIKVVGGAAAAYMGIKKNNHLLTGAGLGLTAQGLNSAAHDFGIIQGVEDFMSGIGLDKGSDAMLIEMNGTEEIMSGNEMGATNVPVVSGSEMPIVAGY